MKNTPYLTNELNTDFKAVTKVAELLEKELFKTDQISILPIGEKKMPSQKILTDIQFITLKANTRIA